MLWYESYYALRHTTDTHTCIVAEQFKWNLRLFHNYYPTNIVGKYLYEQIYFKKPFQRK
jgi:hypothetical protein